jgi:hypothetical protein
MDVILVPDVKPGKLPYIDQIKLVKDNRRQVYFDSKKFLSQTLYFRLRIKDIGVGRIENLIPFGLRGSSLLGSDHEFEFQVKYIISDENGSSSDGSFKATFNFDGIFKKDLNTISELAKYYINFNT